jgi:hypothetical protein
VFEKRALRRIFVYKREEVTEDWRKVHIEEPHNLYSSPNIINMRLRWTGYVARMGIREMRTKFCLESLKGRDHLEDLGADERIILKSISGK